MLHWFIHSASHECQAGNNISKPPNLYPQFSQQIQNSYTHYFWSLWHHFHFSAFCENNNSLLKAEGHVIGQMDCAFWH